MDKTFMPVFSYANASTSALHLIKAKAVNRRNKRKTYAPLHAFDVNLNLLQRSRYAKRGYNGVFSVRSRVNSEAYAFHR